MRKESKQHLLAEQHRLAQLVPAVQAELRGIAGVRGVGVGPKEIGGEISDDFAFRIYVDRKRPASDLRRDERIPKALLGVPTDVIVKGGCEEIVDPDQHRPLIGGISAKNEYVQGDDRLLAGTLGCLVELNVATRDVMALTCEHVVLAADATLGVKVGQPNYWVSCCCCVHGQIGSVHQAVKNDRVDCALVRLDEDIVQEIQTGSTLNQVRQIGTLTGVAQAACWSTVRKRGRTTELTEGTVVDVIYEGNQILVNPTGVDPDPFADVGDSGSVLVDEDEAVVGLVWARDATNIVRGVANHIGEVMRELNIRIAGSDASGLVLPTSPCPPAPTP